MFLTLRELRSLTGRVHRRCVIEWLRSNQWRFVLDSDGTPKVSRTYFEQRLGVYRDDTYVESSNQPNFSALDKRRKRG